VSAQVLSGLEPGERVVVGGRASGAGAQKAAGQGTPKTGLGPRL
jgi:hypothetical protein